ncbi:MAG TPA: histidine kinase [Telluria sp.]|nr:histidine kinase [Telluria sp.]
MSTLRLVLRSLAVNLVFWTLLYAAAALISYDDALRHGRPAEYWSVVRGWWTDGFVPVIMGTMLPVVFTRWPQLRRDYGLIVLCYVIVLAVAIPVDIYFVGYHELVKANMEPTFSAGLERLADNFRRHWFVDVAEMTAIYAALVGAGLWRDARSRESALQAERERNLQLQLALEQQRMQALRAQLEPHFMFNALNAISALVRSGDGKLALSGITRLSELLRYALRASANEWVTLESELQFVKDYLALQQLRYGDRLRVDYRIDADALSEACPPLLLQPLVENALRHDLDCHGEASTLGIDIQRAEGSVTIRIDNPLRANANPGHGLGLPQTTARLRLAWGETATLKTGPQEDRFIALLSLPVASEELAA